MTSAEASRAEARCIFCKIFRKELPGEEVLRTDDALVFKDINPQAPLHLLVIPKRHAAHLADFVASAGKDEIAELFTLASQIGRQYARDGYRVVVNEGRDGGQTVYHLHLHVLAGRHMTWPPG
ncbi:MAG: histidine triad nucleotide-binding protein [Vulcanimicrobiaceae bacterium]